MCQTIQIIKLHSPDDIVKAYDYALNDTKFSTILVENPDFGK